MKFSSSHVYLINQKPKIYKKKRTYSSVIVRQHDLSIKSRPFNRISTFLLYLDLSIESRSFNQIICDFFDRNFQKRCHIRLLEGKSDLQSHPRAYSGVTRNPKIYSSLTNTARRPRHASNTTKTPDLQLITGHGILTGSCHYVATATWRRLLLTASCKKSGSISASALSGYCDSNTGPSGPKPDALANCATPRLSFPFIWDCKYRDKK